VATLTWEQAVAWARETPEMSDLVRVCYYDDPIEAAAARFKDSEEWPAILSFLPPRPGCRVLEIGAGRGIVSWAFASEGYEVYAQEPDRSALVGSGAIRQLCAATGVKINIVEDVGERLVYPEQYFDYVVCRGVLHHVRDLDQVCREAFRVLRPGGRFLAIKEHVADTPEELEAFLRIHPLHHLYGGEHAFALETYIRSLRAAGFRRVINYGHYDHPITSAPAVTTPMVREKFEGALGLRISSGLAARISKSDALLRVYRRWLTISTKIPGRLHSFQVEKPL
jgi:SAM-dependent methyltransferase